jgi:hypothetical protein
MCLRASVVSYVSRAMDDLDRKDGASRTKAVLRPAAIGGPIRFPLTTRSASARPPGIQVDASYGFSSKAIATSSCAVRAAGGYTKPG